MRSLRAAAAAMLLGAALAAGVQAQEFTEPGDWGPEPLVGLEASDPPAAEEPEQSAFEQGIASWYGPGFHGRRTASGERFDMHALTAAHPSLPFGTIVRVESAVNGRSVEVRINDRGPHIKQRIIDLSRAAARALGLLEAGTGTKPVVVKVVKPVLELR